MAGAAAEAGTAEKAAAILKLGCLNPGFLVHHVIALVRSRDTPMRGTRCQSPGFPPK
jgi:hypothetical protein